MSGRIRYFNKKILGILGMAMEISATLDLRFWGLITVQYTNEKGTTIVEHVEIRCGRVV